MKTAYKNLISVIKKGKIVSGLRNKYVITIAAFFTWMLFFDDNDIATQVRLRIKLSDYRSQRDYYEQRITDVKREKQELLTNQQSLEKFAREEYMMKKDDEDLFVIVPSDENKE